MSTSASVGSSAVLPEHCFYCFEVISAHLHRHSSKASNSQEQEIDVAFPDESAPYPLFITWNIFSSTSALARASQALTGSYADSKGGTSSARLRGCIGTFEPKPLKQGLAEYAHIAAFEDRRFSPISQNELSRLECGVSLLTSFEDCADYLDWELGTHGIYIHLTPPADASLSSVRRNRTLTATYLPDVAPAQGWSKEEAVESAIRKAGFEGRITRELKEKGLKVRRYQSEKITRNYDEWSRWREGQRK